MPKKTKQSAAKATFIETMECLPVTEIPQGPEWSYELKLAPRYIDHFRLLSNQRDGGVASRYTSRHYWHCYGQVSNPPLALLDNYRSDHSRVNRTMDLISARLGKLE
jgi:hypothetical protein